MASPSPFADAAAQQAVLSPTPAPAAADAPSRRRAGANGALRSLEALDKLLIKAKEANDSNHPATVSKALTKARAELEAARDKVAAAAANAKRPRRAGGPPSEYNLFIKANMASVKEANKELSYPECMKIVAGMWKEAKAAKEANAAA